MKKKVASPIKPKGKRTVYTVKSPFTDKYNKSVHEIGSDVSHFDSARLSDLVKRGLVKKS